MYIEIAYNKIGLMKLAMLKLRVKYGNVNIFHT